jgi:hypothetical protein
MGRLLNHVSSEEKLTRLSETTPKQKEENSGWHCYLFIPIPAINQRNSMPSSLLARQAYQAVHLIEETPTKKTGMHAMNDAHLHLTTAKALQSTPWQGTQARSRACCLSISPFGKISPRPLAANHAAASCYCATHAYHQSHVTFSPETP